MSKPNLYNAIPSTWFDWPEIYDEAVATAPQDGVLVEVGSFWGKSAVYLAEAAKMADKGLRVFCVDLWDMRPDNNAPLFDQALGGAEAAIHAQHNGSLFETMAYYVDRTRLSPDPLRIMRMSSLEAALLLTSVAPLHMVFLDGDHEYDYVLQELRVWYPMIGAGGLIAGHDYTEEFDGVRRATKDYFKRLPVEVTGWSWIVRR